MSQQQYDEYGVLIRPRPSQQQVQTVDDYGVPIKKKVGGGTSSTASDIVATPSESPSNLPSGLQEGSSVFPTKENPLPLLEAPKTVTTFDGTPLSISPEDKSPYANALRQSPSALSQLQQRVLSKTTTPLDLEVLSSGSNKSVAATHAYITKGKDVGAATEINDNTQSTEQFLKNSISGLSKEMGAVNNPDEIANNPDEGASFLSKLHTAIKATQGMSGYLQGVVPFVKSAYDVAENLLSGKVDKDKLATDVQQLSENAGTKVEDKQKAFVAQAQKALPVLVQNITDQTAKEAFDKGIEDSQAIDLLYKRLDPESYEKSVEMRNATPQSASTKVGTSILNGVAAIKNFSDWVTNADENNKELLNAEKGQYELLLNRGLGNYAAQLKAKGISTGDQQLIEQANTLIPKIQDESAIVEKYPMLIKQQMADYINQRYAEETGILNGTEVQGANGRLLKYGGVNTDAAKRYLREGGFYDKPNFKDYADDVAEHPATYLATGNTVAGAPMQFLNVFKSIFNSVADLEGFRTAEDRHAENIKSQMFPSELTENIKPDISFDLGGHHFETTVAKTLNGVAHLGGYMATAALGSAIGGAAGLSGSAAARVGAWSSFGADAIDSGLKTADQLNLTPAQSWLYAGMNAVMMAEGGRLLEFGKATPVPQIAGVNQKIADAAIGLTNKTLTEGAAKELVDGAVNTWAGALKKWGIGTAKGAGVMTAFGVGDKMLRVAAGDPNANLNDILPEAANAYFDGLLTMGVIGGFGLPADIAKAKNSTYKAALSSIVDNHDAAKDILQIGLDRGLFSKQEYDQKVAVLNTGLKAKASLNGAIAKTGVSIDGKQRQTWIANATAEKVLRDQAEKEGVSQEEAAQYIKQADALKEQNGKIFNGLKFSKLLEPQYNLYDAQQALNEAQKVYAETPTPENEQSVIDKKAIFDKFNENYLNGIPENKTNEATQAENTVPVSTEKTGTTNEAVDNAPLIQAYRDRTGIKESDVSDEDLLRNIAEQAQNMATNPETGKQEMQSVINPKAYESTVKNIGDKDLVDAAIEKYPAPKDEAKPYDPNSGKVIVEPSKPISEMNSEEIGAYANEVRQALKKQDKEFANKTEKEKEDGGYYDYIDNVAELRDTEQRVNFVENSENLDDLANSTKSALRDFNKDNPSQESLAILNAAKKKAAEMNIEPETLIKEVIKKVGNDYKDKNDAEFMMRNYLEKIVPTETQAEQQPIVNSNNDSLPNYGKTVDTKIGKVDLVVEPNTESENKNSVKISAYDVDGNTMGFSSAIIDPKNKTITIKVSQIKEKFQRNGIYSKIVDEFENIAKDKGLTLEREIAGETKASKDFWQNRESEKEENKPTISKEQDKKGSESEELGVGTKWDSPSGKKEITGSVMVGNEKQFTISIDGKHSNELIKVADLQKDIARDKSDLKHREEARKEGDITRDKEAKKQEFYNNTNGFADGKSPMEKAKILKVLNTEQLYNGELKVRKTFIEDAVANGGTVKEVNGKKRLYYNGNRFIDNLTKTEYDYADYLNQIKNKPKEQTEPTTKEQPEQEVTIGRNEIKGLNNSVNNGLEQDNRQAINYLNQSLKKGSNIDFEGVSTSEGAATKVTGVTNKGGARVENVNSNSLELNFRNKSTGDKINQVLHFKTEEDLNKAIDFIYSKHKDREIQQPTTQEQGVGTKSKEPIAEPNKLGNNKNIQLTSDIPTIDRTKIPVDSESKSVDLGSFTASNGDNLSVSAEDINLSYPGKNKFVRKITATDGKNKAIISFWKDKNKLIILHVESDKKGAGYGTDLVNKVIDEAKSLNVEQVIADNVESLNSEKYWAKKGFIQDPESRSNRILNLKKEEPISEPTNKVENNSKNKQIEVTKPRTQSPLPTKEEISKYSAKDKLALVNAVRNKDAKAIQEITERNRGGNVKFDKSNNGDAAFETRDGKRIGFDYDTDKVARERFDFSKLKQIGKGSDRTVFDLGDGKVLKVAHTARGLEQNIYEGDRYLKGTVPDVHERGLNYVVTDKVPRIKANDIVPTYDIETGEQNGTAKAGEMIRELGKFNQKDFDNKTSGIQDALRKYGLGDVMDYDVLYGDFKAGRNWGYENGRPVHIDGGTFGGTRMLDNYKGKAPLSDPEFRGIYNKSKALKKQFGDTDKNTKFQKSEIKTDEGTMPVEQYVSRAKAVLEKLFPKAKFEAYDTTADYLDAGGTYGSKGLSRVDGKGNRTIMLDLQEIRDSGSGKTAFHEVIHPIVDEVVGERPEELNPLWNSLAEQMKDVKGFGDVLLHVGNYKAHEHPAAEGITELLTQISEGNISLDAVPPARKGVIIDLLNKLFEKLGLNIRFGDSYDFKSFATDIKKAFETGDTESLKQVVDKKSEENQRAKDNASKISKLLFGSDKADKSETDINDVVKQLRELGLTDKEIEEGLKQSGDSEADIKRALGGGGKSGNVGETEVLGQGDGNAITHAAISEFRAENNFEQFSHTTVTDAELNKMADKAIAKGYNVNDLWHRISLGHNPNDVEVAILKKVKSAIKEAVEKDPSSANLRKALNFADASDMAGQIAGRAFRARQDIDEIDVSKQSLDDFFVTRMRNKGVTPETMTDAQKSEIQKQYKDLKDAHDKLEAKVAKLVEADAKRKAESAVKKMKDRTSSQPKKTHEEYVKERKSLVEQLKAAKAKAEERMKGITKSGFSVTVTPEMVKIIGKIAYSHVSEGAQKLQEVSQKVYNEIKDVFEGVTQQDVIDVLAGAYNAVKPEKNDILKQMAALRSEAIKESAIAKEKKDAQRLKTIKKTYQRKIDKLKEDLRTGKYLLPKDVPEPLKYDQEALDLQDKYISVRKETQRLIAKDEYIKKSSADRFWINSAEALNIMRTIMSSSDFSAVLRQAVVPTIAHPLIAVKSMGGMFRDAFSQKLFDRWLFDLKESPVYDEMVRSKVYISDPNDVRLSKKEEAFMNNFVEKVPVIGSWLVKGSERAYLSYLNRMRVELYQLGSDVMARNGKTIENSPKDFEGLGSFVNNMTGRGGVPESMELATPLISAGIFAPRLIASRLNLLGITDIPNIITRVGTAGQKGINVGFYSKLPPEIRRMAITDMAKFVMFGSAVLGLASLFGNDDKNKTVEFDPRSSDFGKIKVGDTRYDMWGGMQQYVVFFSRMIKNETKSVNGKMYDLDGKGAFGRTRADVIESFVRGKSSPALGMGWDFVKGGRTIVGDKILYGNLNPFGDHKRKEITGGAYFAEHFLPMTSGDITDALESGDMRNLFAIPATIFGISVQTFNDKK